MELPELRNPIVSSKIVGENVDYAEYSNQVVARGHPSFVMSRSELVEFNHCPIRWLNGFVNKDSDATGWGTLIDCLVLTPDKTQDLIAVCPSTYRNEKGEEKPWTFQANVCKEWKKKQNGKLIVKYEDWQEAQYAAKLIKDEFAMPLAGAKRQVWCEGLYRDKLTELDVTVRCLIDLVPLDGHSLLDLKTCSNAAQRAWRKVCYEYGYHLQAAMELDLWNKAMGDERDTFRHILQENYRPYQMARKTLDLEFISLGRLTYLDALRRYCRCLKTHDWPGYDEKDNLDGWQQIGPDPYMINP